MKIIIVIIVLFILCVAWFYSYSLREHLGKKNHPDRNLDRVVEHIEMLGLDYYVLEKVNYFDKSYPLFVVTRNPSNTTTNFSLCIFSGVHGDEPAGVEASLKFMSEITHESRYSNLYISIIPVVNPWGWIHNIRRNGDIKDVNRSFINEPTQESILLKKFLDQQSCSMVVDLHEDQFHKSFYLLSYGDKQLSKTQQVAKDIELTGVSLKNSAPNGVHHIDESEFNENSYPTLSLYARMNKTAYSYIIETPRELEMRRRVELHLNTLRKLIDNATNKALHPTL